MGAWVPFNYVEFQNPITLIYLLRRSIKKVCGFWTLPPGGQTFTRTPSDSNHKQMTKFKQEIIGGTCWGGWDRKEGGGSLDVIRGH